MNTGVTSECRNHIVFVHITLIASFGSCLRILLFSLFLSFFRYATFATHHGHHIHTLVILLRIVLAAFCMLELVDVICLTREGLSAVSLIRVNLRRHSRNTLGPGNLELIALILFSARSL